MDKPVIGFIGFGEASYSISSGLVGEGVTGIKAYDVMTSDPKLGVKISKRAKKLQVDLRDNLQSLIEDSDIIFCATSAKYAVSIAKEITPFLRENQIYVDINAASPMAMKEIATLLEATPAYFIDAAVMEPIPPYKHKVPMLLSGKGSKELEKITRRFGMNMKYISDEAGASSAIKMVRSVFIKGFTMLMLETLSAAEKFNVSKEILASISRTLMERPLGITTNLLLTRSVKHANRRVAEMQEVLKTLQAINIDDTMSQATEKKYQMLTDRRIKEKFEKEDPKDFSELITALGTP